MTVKISVGPPSYNKGAPPSKTPQTSIYPIHKCIEEYEFWVSIPRPDKLHLIGDVLPQHFAAAADLAPTDIGPVLMTALATPGKLGEVLNTWLDDKIYRRVQVDVGSKKPVFFELKKAPPTSPAVHQLEIQFNPSRLGQDGIFELLQRLHAQTPHKFLVGPFLAGARTKALDVAIDVVGIRVSDLLAKVPDTGKISHYFRTTLETVNFHRPIKTDQTGKLSEKGKLNPAGPVFLKMYDKRLQLIAVGETTPFGDAEITRVEVSKTRFGNKPFPVASLPALSNPFKKVKVGLVQTAGPSGSWTWPQYVEARRGGGHAQAVKVNQLTGQAAKDFAHRFENPPGDVIDGANLWTGWKDGLEATGLIYLVEAAEQLSSDVPLPAECS